MQWRLSCRIRFKVLPSSSIGRLVMLSALPYLVSGYSAPTWLHSAPSRQWNHVGQIESDSNSMSFITFKLDHPPGRSTPVPIAAAGPQAPSKWQDVSSVEVAPRRKIACISCQIPKARCEPPFSGSDKCRRCLRLQRECTVHLSKDSALPANETLPSYETHPYPERYSKAGLGNVTSSPDRQPSVFFSEGFAEASPRKSACYA